jgi:hypothetical protein
LFVAAGGGRAGREGDPCVEEAVPHGIEGVGVAGRGEGTYGRTRLIRNKSSQVKLDK